MGHTVKYNQGSRKERLNAALEDALIWLGGWNDRQTHRLIVIIGSIKLMDGPARQKVRTARFALRFTGIQGAPATAFIKYVWSLVK